MVIIYELQISSESLALLIINVILDFLTLFLIPYTLILSVRPFYRYTVITQLLLYIVTIDIVDLAIDCP